MSTIPATANVDLCMKVQRELFGAGRLELADELIAADCVDHGAENSPSEAGRAAGAQRGPEAIKGVVRWLRGAFPNLSYEIEDAFGDGDRVAIRCTARGTHQGEFLGRQPTGRSFAVQQIHTFRVSDGQIAEHWAARDDAGMMRQLGLVG
ncbi:MAG: ester cyclase [Solirubrobacteraceae bacterium]